MKQNFDADEKEFLAEIDSSLSNLRASAGPCPHPDLVMAAAAGVRSDSSERVLQHLNACPVCRQLAGDLSDYEYPGVSEEEDKRIRARWERPGSSANPSWWAWTGQPYAIGAVAAVLIAAIALAFALRQGVPQQNQPASTADKTAGPERTPAVQATKTRTAFVLSKAAIKVPATAVLTFRSGSDDARAFLNDLAAALEPYRSDDFAAAARRLGPLVQKYPQSAEVPYYLGVSRLFLDQNSAALESLEAARRLADENLRDDVSWYLAIAFERAGRMDDARREIGTLCSRAGDYQKQACAALEELR